MAPCPLSSECNEERRGCAERHLTRNKRTLMTAATVGSVPGVVWKRIMELNLPFQLRDMELDYTVTVRQKRKKNTGFSLKSAGLFSKFQCVIWSPT